MKCLCLPDPRTGTATVVDHVRLFRNHTAIRWQYRVHEQILPAIRRTGGQVRWTSITIQHTGYQDPALRRRKLERDLRLLRLEDAEQPDDPFTLFNWGEVEQVARRLEEGGQERVEAAVLRARGHLARQEFTQARQLLAETIARAPAALGSRSSVARQ